jgi:hypothetical protein
MLDDRDNRDNSRDDSFGAHIFFGLIFLCPPLAVPSFYTGSKRKTQKNQKIFRQPNYLTREKRTKSGYSTENAKKRKRKRKNLSVNSILNLRRH